MISASTAEIDRIAADIIAGMSPKEKSLIAHMRAERLPHLQYAFDMDVDREIGDDPALGRRIMKCVWQQLQATHRIRLAK